METKKTSWTESQQTAIDANCADNLVSAAAGSGKTAVMVERIVSRVINGDADIDRLLVVTFTNAAASELKSRLMSKIMDALDSEMASDRLNRQLVMINNASICTIDSFCLDVLKNNFYRLGLDPSFKIADNAELEIAKGDILSEIFEEYYEREDAVFLKLVDCYTKKNDSYLFELIGNIFKFTNSLPCGTDELLPMAQSFSDSSLWEKYFIDKAHTLASDAVSCYNTAIGNINHFEGLDKQKALLFDEKNNFELILKRDNWNDIKKAVSCFEFGTLAFPRNLSDEEKNTIKLPRDRGRKLKKEFEELFSEDYELLLEDISYAREDIDKLVEITLLFAGRFAEYKKEKGVVDFTDVEHMTLKLLQNEDGGQSDVAKLLMSKYDEIYLDEYQDCNLVQEKIFSLISRANEGNPNMFMVGDMKQSIYGFRGSEPSLFKQKADSYTHYADGGKYNKIILSRNFRSRKCIIDGVNSVFSQIMSKALGELEYNDEEYLYYNDGSYDETNNDMNKIDITFIESSDSKIQFDEEESDYFTELKGAEAEAIHIANTIKKMVNDPDVSGEYKVFDKKQGIYRRAKYSDIVILLRSGGASGKNIEPLSRILTSAQIPVYCDLKSGYFDTPEVAFLINFLKIIDNPYDDIALLSVMRHPVISFNDDEFVCVRLQKPKGYFYSSVNKYADENEDALSAKLKNFIEILRDFYDKSKYMTTDRLIWEIIKKTDYMSYLAFLSNSDIRKANVRTLISRAYEFEKSSYKGIFDFIRYIDTLQKNNKDVEPAKTLSDEENVVRIMTIHKSKGLEFPIVFLANAFKPFYDSDIKTEKLLMDKDCGFGVNFYDYNKHYYYELPQKKLIKDVKYNKLLSEEMRVLYVALTRPKEKLIITGSDRNLLKKIEKLSALLSEEGKTLSANTVKSGKSFGDWIVLSVLRNKNLISDIKLPRTKTKIDDGSVFKLDVLTKDSLMLEVNAPCEKRDINSLVPLSENGKWVEQRLDFEYPYKALSQTASNISVTELKRIYAQKDEDVYDYFKDTKLSLPKFYDGEDKASAMEIGTFTHLVMEKLDITKVSCIDDIKTQVQNLTEQGFLTENQAKYINFQNILRIFSTDIGKNMISRVDSLKREFGFKFSVDASEIFGEETKNESVVVQGMIDAYYEDNDGCLVIVDYKTDRVDGNIEQIKHKYATQLKYYKLALEKALGKSVKKTCLMLMDSGEAVEVDTI